MNVCIVNHPNTSNYTPLDNLILVLLSIFPNIHCIYGEKEFNQHKFNVNITHHSINISKCFTLHRRIFSYINLQLKISKHILTSRNQIDACIFFIGGDTLLLPILFSKILNKKVILLLAGSSIKTHQENQDTLVIGLKLLRKPCLSLAERIIVYSPQLIRDYHLTPYRHKILIAHRHFLDFTTFTFITPYPDRPHLIGYIGRLSGEKGVQHFAKALPAILSNHHDLRVLIGGDGQLKDAIEASLQETGVADRVDLPGWISHDDLPKYLNKLRLLVLPSYTEGLPNIMLEAMACGTPVLATPVGAIPDVIRDGETGFIMEDNSPECIARNVMRALNDPDLQEVAKRGRKFVEEEYTFEKVVERWRIILERL